MRSLPLSRHEQGTNGEKSDMAGQSAARREQSKANGPPMDPTRWLIAPVFFPFLWRCLLGSGLRISTWKDSRKSNLSWVWVGWWCSVGSVQGHGGRCASQVSRQVSRVWMLVLRLSRSDSHGLLPVWRAWLLSLPARSLLPRGKGLQRACP